MRARDRQYPAICEHVAREPVRSGQIRHTGVENRFDERIAATPAGLQRLNGILGYLLA